jgi:Alkylmercury lyase
MEPQAAERVTWFRMEEFAVHLTVLAVPGCPSSMVLEERLSQVLRGRPDVTVSRHVIADQDEAARLGMHGSPTILVDGKDPFAGPRQPASISCRLYRDSNGNADGAPSVCQLRQVIRAADALAADVEAADAEAADALAAYPRDCDWADGLGRAGRGRTAPAERGLRAVHQAVLRSFAAAGHPPAPGDLAEAARPFDAGQALAELAAGDYLSLDRGGRIVAAYPFSAMATPHSVEIGGGASTYSMCAIDALGIAEMLRTSVLISSADPLTGDQISVAVDKHGAVWKPGTTVVFAGRLAGQCTGPSAAVCCSYMNFFISSASAANWARAHPAVTGRVLSQRQALELGVQIFGQLLQ